MSIALSKSGAHQSIELFAYDAGIEYDFKIDSKKNSIRFRGIDYNKDNDDTRLYKGSHSMFFRKKTDPFGYKLFLKPSRHENETRARAGMESERVDWGSANKIFKIQNLLSSAGYSPRAQEIIKCFDGAQCLFIVKMDYVKGAFVKPSKEYIDDFCSFCEENRLVRPCNYWSCTPNGNACTMNHGAHRPFTDVYHCTISAELSSSGNCILSEKDSKLYMVDIDRRWRQI